MKPLAEHAGERHAVRFGAVLGDAGAGAFVAARAFGQVEHEQALALV